MKQLFQFLIIVTFLVACSPKYTELNDHGFGGGFSQKGIENNHSHKSIAAESNEIQTIPLKEEDSVSKECQFNPVKKVDIEGKKTIFYPSKLFKSKLQNLKISKLKIKKLFKPESKKRQSALSFPDSYSSVWKWILVIWGIVELLVCLYIYVSIDRASNFIFDIIFGYLSFFGLIAGAVLLIIGLLID